MSQLGTIVVLNMGSFCRWLSFTNISYKHHLALIFVTCSQLNQVSQAELPKPPLCSTVLFVCSLLWWFWFRGNEGKVCRIWISTHLKNLKKIGSIWGSPKCSTEIWFSFLIRYSETRTHNMIMWQFVAVRCGKLSCWKSKKAVWIFCDQLLQFCNNATCKQPKAFR